MVKKIFFIMLFFVLACEDNITSEQEDGHNHDDHDHSSDTIFTPLAPPENGFQLRFGPMEIPPNSEREVFQYTDIGHSEDIYVNRVEFEMRPGSHHFILYSFNPGTTNLPNLNEVRDLYDESGQYNQSTFQSMEEHIALFGTQWSRLNYQLPTGIAVRLPAEFGLDQNSHYVNQSDTTLIGEVITNIHTLDYSEVEHIAELFSLSNEQIYLPANQSTTITRTFYFDSENNIGQLFSHAHQLMTNFVVEIDGGSRNGEVVYQNDDWSHPPIVNYDPAIKLNAGEGLKMIATYNNPHSYPVIYGLKSTDEMMMIFGWRFQ